MAESSVKVDGENDNIKLLTLGDTNVGKSWLLLRWTEEKKKFRKDAKPMATIGIDYGMKKIKIHENYHTIKVWDTAGQERYRTITTSYYRKAQGVLLVYDITNRNSFLHIRDWIKEIDLHTNGKIAKVLVGNKCDLIRERMVTYPEGEQLAREFHMPFFETSALNNVNVDEMFTKLTQDIVDHTQQGHSILAKSTPSPPEPASSGSCCSIM